MSTSKDATQLLLDAGPGSRSALDQLVPLIFAELRRLAAGYLRRERADHTLQPTALVHEAYLRLIEQEDVRWQNRAHFMAIAARTMRSILVDHARKHNAAKRGGGRRAVSLDNAWGLAGHTQVDWIALDEALVRLAALDPKKGQIVELRFFGGLSVEETAEAAGLSPAAVKRGWSTARAWLFRELRASRGDEPGPGARARTRT